MSNHKLTTVIVDTDALFALFNKDDANAQKAENLIQILYEQKVRLLYPATMLVETIDTLQRKLKRHEEAAQVTTLISSSQFAIESIEPISGDILRVAATYFEKNQSKQITLADCVVAAVAKKYNAIIFSFDNWYKKMGFRLVPDIYSS
jgi:predicted nucleic acid-binding protein